MSDMKCPICGNKLEKSYNGGVFCTNLDCELAETILGVEAVKIWIDTKKQLKTAVNALKYIQDGNLGFSPAMDFAEKALEQITALEQKDVK